jgi:hypothetical protein
MQDSNLLTHVMRWHGRAAVEPVYGTGVVVEETVPRGAATPVIDALWRPGCGYEIACFAPRSAPARQLSSAAKGSMRRKALARRVNAAAPLFAADLYAAALAKNSAYFDGE